MRLERLGLVAYGKFTDRWFDFPKPCPGAPDLHLIYGPNEAGKSTLFSAILDLMFGMPGQSGYAFLHDYAAMRLEATVAADGSAMELARIKRNDGGLRGVGDAALADDPFARWLGGIDRQAYRAMFSLDEKSLAEGGQELLKAEGDFGRILFGASAGLTGLTERLQSLEGQAGAFHRPHARNTTLRQLAQRLDALNKEKAEADVRAPEFERLIAARDAAEAASEAARAAADVALKRLDALKRQADALPKLAAYRAAVGAAAELTDLATAPEGARATLDRLKAAAAKLDGQASDLDERIAGLEATLEAPPADQAAFDAGPAVDAMADLASRFRTAENDLPRRRAERDEADQAMALEARRLTDGQLKDPRALPLTPEVSGRIRELADAWPDLSAAERAARNELAKAEAGLAGPPMDAAEEARLRAAQRAARQSAAPARRDAAARDVADLTVELQAALASLAPWRGDAATLAEATPPAPETIEGWRTERLRLTAAVNDWQERTDTAKGAAKAANARAEALGTAIGDLDDAALQERIARRAAAWAAHRATLDLASADAFEREMQALDAAKDARFANAAKVGEASAARAAAWEEAAKAEAAAATLAARREELAATGVEIAAAAEALGLGRDATPEALARWRDGRAEALRISARIAAAEARRAGAADEADALTAALGEALGLEGDLAMLMEAGEARLKQSDAAAAVAGRRKALAEAEAAVSAWREDWGEALAGSWLEALAETPASVRDALEDARALAGQIADRDKLAGRIEKMEADQAAFLAALEATGLDPDMSAPATAFESLKQRVARARSEHESRRAQAEALHKERTTREAVAAKQAADAAERDAFLATLGAEDLEAAGAILDRIDRAKAAAAEAERLEADILRAAGADTPEAAMAALDGLEPDTLAADIAHAEADCQASQEAAHERYAELDRARRALDAIGGDGAAAALETRRQTVLAEIGEGARQALRLRLGGLVASAALERFRAERQSAMLARASAAFSQITGGAYQGLRTQAGNKAEELIAVAAGGGSRLDDDKMSAGTRAQLYLALRIAGYHAIAEERAPPPFLADDIFETFDDARASEAFRLLGEMATLGQVIYLTHHEHLIPIAEAAAPGVRVHRL